MGLMREARRAGTLYADIDLSCPCDASLEILREQGYGSDEIAALRAAKII